jgi:hypothetical protein
LHIDQVYSVEFGPAEKIFFRSLPGYFLGTSVLDFEFKLEDLGRNKQIYRFRVIWGRIQIRRIQIHREKKYLDHSLGQYRTSHIDIFN